MKLYLSIFLALAILFQPMTKFIIVSNYALNVKTITAKYCVNKAKPKMRCNGKCHLNKQLIQQDKQSNQDKNNAKESNAFQWYTTVNNKTWAPLLYNKTCFRLSELRQECDPYILSLFRPPTC